MQKRHLLLILLMALFAPLAMNGQTTLLNEDFNSLSTDNSIPNGWDNSDGTTSSASYKWCYTSSSDYNGNGATVTTGHNSTKCVRFDSYYNSSNNTNFLKTPVLDLSAATAASLTFWYKNPAGGDFSVYISTDGGSTYTTSLVTGLTGQSSWTSRTISLNNYVGAGKNNVVIVFKGTSNWGSNDAYIYLDDVTVDVVLSGPAISLSPASATVLTGSTQTLTATTYNVTGTPTITYSTSNASVATVSGSGTSATVTAVAHGTATITATMTYNSNTYTAQCAITVEDPSYCEPIPSSRDGNGITAVAFGTDDVVNNSSSSGLPSSAPYYGDYTSMVGSFEAGEVATVSITYTTGTSTYYNYGTLIWVDWNKDYIFDDSEIVFQGQSSQQSNPSGPHTLDATFTVPASQAADDYRMRIAGADSYFDRYLSGYSDGAHDACFSSTYAVCHDYTLRVVALGAYTITCATTTGGTITADKTNADENDVVTITATPDADYLLTALTYTPEGGSAQNIDITNTPYTFTMPAANVTVNATFSQPTCPKPTNVTASNITVNLANISWNGEADSYNVRYATATISGSTLDPVFEDGFENGLGNWTTYANGYVSTADPTAFNNTNWHQMASSSSVTPHTGSYVAMSRSYDGEDRSVDNWLVSPQMTLGDVVKFWVCGDNANWQEYYTVYVSVGTNAISDFVLLATPALAPGDGSWAERTVQLGNYAGQQGYVAIRHTDTGKDYLFVDDFGVYNTVNAYSYGSFTTLPPTSETACDITGLSPETLYVAQVQADCGSTDGTSSWVSVYFTTPDACGAPTNLVSSDITATTATLGWADNQDSYNVRYRKVYFYEGFEGETLPMGWTTIDANNDGLTWGTGHATAHSGHNGAYNVSYVYNTTGTTPNDYLVSPQLDLQGTLRVWLSGYAREGSNYSEHFAIYLSTTGNTASDFTTTLVGETTTTNGYVEYTADLSSYAGQKGYIAIRHFNCSDQYYLYVDDFGLYGSENWVSVNPNPTDATTTLTGLTPTIENENHYLPTNYEWQVQGINCDGNGGTTDWSAPATFTTLEGYFKEITGYGTGNGNWYLIATPLAGQNGETDPTSVTNLINENGYDLYRFNQNAVLEWENYKGDENEDINHAGFKLESGKGYLYANKEDVQLVFTGSAYTGTNTFDLTYSEDNLDAIQHGWNLVGNPFATSASVNQSFCTLNNTSDGISTTAVNAGGTIGAMEGVFVKATGTGKSVTFTQGGAKKSRSINIDVTRNGEFLDRAIVSLSTDGSLCKLSLSDNTTKVYFRQDQKDYAIITSENENEMPVSFKASRNGNYTITVNAEEVEFNYLHLIDNLTGNDVDLLANPFYSFDAKTTDYASRFKLVFVCGDANGDDDTFAFFSNGGFVINNEGKATLQVIDVNGRILKSESIDGCANVNVNAAPGVYMIRLINGDNVKTQKVVVK